MNRLQKNRCQILWGLVAMLVLVGSLPAQPPTVAKRPRRVFIPIEDLGVVIDRDRRGVMLEKAEYNKLRTLAARNERDRPRTPASLALREVVYTARPNGDRLSIDTSVRFQQFVRGWQSLRLPLRGVSVEKAVLEGRAARVARFQLTRKKVSVSGLELFHNTVGVATLELGLSTPLAAVGSDRVAAFGLVPAATASLIIHLPAGKHLLVDGLSVRRPAAADQPATYNLPVGGRSEIRLAVTDRQAQRSGDALVFASTAFGVGVSPGEVTWQAVTGLEVFGKALDEYVATVPRTLEITEVASSGLESWELADDPDNAQLTQITLHFRQRFTGSRRVSFRGVMTTPVGQLWQVPRLSFSGVTSHIGQLLVHTPPGVRLQSGQATGVRRVPDVMVLQKILEKIPAGSSAMRFDAWREDFTLSFATETKRQELQAALATLLKISDDGLDLVTDARIESRFSSLFQVVFSIPDGWNITGVRVAGQSAPWQRLPGADGRQRLRVGFAKAVPEGSEVSVSVLAHRDLENWPLGSANSRDVALPDIALEIAGEGRKDQAGLIVEGRYLIRASDEFEVVADELIGLDHANLKLEGQRLGYSYQSPRVSGTLRIGRRPARLSAESLTVARLDRETLSAHLESHLDIQGGGARQVVIDLPEWAGEDLRFRLLDSANRIVEQLPAAPVDGRRRWTLKLDKFVRNRLSLSVDLTLTREMVTDGGSGFRLPALAVIGADRDNGYVAIEAADDQQVDVTALEQMAVDGDRSAELAEIDPIDLPTTQYRPRERVVKAYRYLVPGYHVTLGEARFDHGNVARAICHGSTVTSVLARTGEMQHRASFDLTAAGVQSLLVDLGGRPGEQRSLWAVTVDGKPVKAHQQQSDVDQPSMIFVVGWPVDDLGAGRHSLEVFYRSKVRSVRRSDRLVQDAPVVSLGRGSQDPRPIEVLEQHWVLHHPWQTLVVESDGRFVPSEDLSQISLLGALKDSMRNLSPTNLLSRLTVLLIVTGVIAVLTLAFRRRRFVGLLAGTAVLLVLGIVLPAMLLTARPPTAFMSESGDAMVDSQMVASPSAPSSAISSDAVIRKGDTFGMEGMGAVGGMGGGGGGAVPPPGGSEQLDRLTEAEQDRPVGSVAKPGSDKGRLRNDVKLAEQGAIEGPDLNLGTRTVNEPSQVEVAAETAKAKAKSESASGAVMSLALDLRPPAGTVAREFHFLGSREPGEISDLDIAYQDVESQTTGRVFFIVLVVIACWFSRRRSAVERSVAMIASLIGPLALVTVLPVSWHIVLDGLFLGAVAGSALWTVMAVIGRAGDGWGWLRANLTRDIFRFGGGLWLAVSLLSQSGWAQVKVPLRPQPRSQSASQVRQRKSLPVPPVVRPLEIIPIEPGQDPREANRVLVPRNEFLRLWNLAYPDRQVLAPAPRSGVVADASWNARVLPSANGVAARIALRGNLQMYSFRDGQVVLPIPIGAVAVVGGRLNGKPAPIVTRAKSQSQPLAVVLDRRGAHRLEIDFELPLVRTGPAGRFSVTLSPVPVGRFRFDLPDRNLLVRVNGSSTRHRHLVADGNESIELGVDAGGPLQVSWQPKQAADAADGLVQLESFTSIHVSDPGVRHRGHYRFRVRQGSLPEATFVLPSTVSVQRVVGVDVGGWDVETENGQRRLRVFFRRRVDDETVVRVDLFQDRRVGDRSAELVVESVRVQGFDRDKGQLAVFVDDQFTARATDNSNLRQVDVASLARPGWCKPSQPRGDGKAVPLARMVFGYITRPFGLTLRLTRRTPQANAVARHAVRIERRKVRLASQIKWQLSQAARGSVTFGLPPKYLPVSVEATSLADWFVHADEKGNRQLTVEFDGPRTGALEVALEGVLPRSSDIEEFQLRLPRPLGVGRLASQVMVWLDEAFSAGITDRGEWRSVNPASAASELRQLDPRKARFAFVSGGISSEPVVLSIKRAVPGMQGTVVSLVTVTDTLVDHTLALSWQITQAAADEFVFTTPGWLKNHLRFRDPRIREVRPVAVDDDEADAVRWIVTLRQPARERLFLIAQATLPPPSSRSATVSSPRVVFEQSASSTGDQEDSSVAYQAVETQQRYVILINQSTGTLKLEDEAGVERVEKDDLGRLPVRIDSSLYDQATGMWRVATRASMPAWNYTRSQALRQTTGTVQLAELVTVLAADGSWRTEAVYTIRNRAQQFLAVTIPEESRVLAVSVGGDQSRPVDSDEARKESVVLVALPNTSEGDLSFPVRMILAGRISGGKLPTGLHLIADRRHIPVPTVVTPRQAADRGGDENGSVFREHGMKVEETSWTVHLPNELDVEPVDGKGTNLAMVGSDRIELNQQRAALDDANYLLGVLESKSSGKAKYKAARNLESLGVELNNYIGNGRRNRPRGFSGGGGADFTLQGRDFQARYRKALERIQVDDGKQRVTNSDDSRNLEGQDEAVQKAQILKNNDRLYRYNAVLPDTGQKQEQGRNVQEFNFKLNLAPPSGEDKKSAAKGKKVPKAAAGGKLATRELRKRRREQSLSQIAGLNRAAEKAEQQVQQEVPYQPQQNNAVGLQTLAAAQDGDGRGPRAGESSLVTPADQQGLADVAGGLSVDFEIPTGGQTLRFATTGENPKLELSMRPRESIQRGLNLLWTIAWLGVGIGVIVALRRPGTLGLLRRHLAKGLLGVGLISFLLLPGGLAWLGFAVFLAGLVIFAFQNRVAGVTGG